MKTKLVCPWNLKVGQKLIQFELNGERRAYPIIEIKKFPRGFFTGRAVWRVTTSNPLWPNSSFHAKSKYLKLQKAEIKVD